MLVERVDGDLSVFYQGPIHTSDSHILTVVRAGVKVDVVESVHRERTRISGSPFP